MSPALLSPRLRWAIVLAVTALTFAYGQVAHATPPNIPSKATAQAELNALTVAGLRLHDPRDHAPVHKLLAGVLHRPDG